MPDPYARPRNTADTNDILAHPPFKQTGELTINARANAAPTPGDVAAFPQGLGGGPNADGPVGSSTAGAIIIHDTSSVIAGFHTNSVFAEVVVSGPAGAEVGLLLFEDGNFDRYVELRIVIGAGTAGKIFLRDMLGGVENWRFSNDDACSVNEHDLPAATDISLRLCIHEREYFPDGYRYRDVAVGTVSAGANTYRVGGPSPFGNNNWKAGLCIAEGSGVTFNDFNFEFAGMPGSGDSSETCTTCETCNLINNSDEAGNDAKWTVAAGTWTLPSSGLVTASSSNARAMLGEAWINDNLAIAIRNAASASPQFTGTPPWTFRYLFSYLSTSTHWCIEWEQLGTSFEDYATRIIERVGGDETIHWSAPFHEAIGVEVYDCALKVSYPFFGSECLGEDFAFNQTGQVGFATKTITDFITVGNYLFAQCSEPFRCETTTGTDTDPPGDPTGCCTDFTNLITGDTVEATISGVTYWLGPGCSDPDCTLTSDFLAELNATHTLRCIYRDTTIVVFYADLLLTNPCESPCTVVNDGVITIDRSLKLWVWLQDIGGGDCRWFGKIGSNCQRCDAYFQSAPFTAPAACDLANLAYASGDGNPGTYNCCLAYVVSAIEVNIP